VIRYDVSPDQLEALVEAEKPGWIADAIATTAELIADGQYSDKSLEWGDVKPVFMALQFNKCIFCEQQMEGERIHHDLEHFRPKSSIKKWPKRADEDLFDFELGDKSDIGYFWLAYDLQNYAAACKFCNTSLKSNYFPIKGLRTLTPGTNVGALNGAELPLICYPIGRLDTKPSQILDFDITLAIPATKSGKRHDRARVMIEFFQLNERDDLHYQRALFIQLMFEGLEQDDTRKTDFLLSDRAPHSACLRAFHKLWKTDHARAMEAYDACRDVVFDALVNETPNLGV